MSDETQSKKFGRPPSYRPEFVDELFNYISEDPYKLDEHGKIEGATDFKSLAGFACKIGVHRDTLYEWSTKKNEDGSLAYPDFSYVYSLVKQYQEHFLATNGLKGIINTNFAALVTKNYLEWREKQKDEVDKTVINNNIHTDKPTEALESRYKQLREKIKAELMQEAKAAPPSEGDPNE